MPITSLYAALLAIFFVGLSIRTIRTRRRLQVAVGDASNPVLLRAMRVHANFAEYVPLALILIFFVETSGAPAAFVYVLGSALLAGRLLHAYGVSQTKENFKFRISGMMLTFSTLLVSSAYLVFSHVRDILN